MQRHKVSKCCWENGADRLVWCGVTINLWFVKKKKHQKTVSLKHNKAKHSKTRYACIIFINISFPNKTPLEKELVINKAHLAFDSISLWADCSLAIFNPLDMDTG